MEICPVVTQAYSVIAKPNDQKSPKATANSSHLTPRWFDCFHQPLELALPFHPTTRKLTCHRMTKHAPNSPARTNPDVKAGKSEAIDKLAPRKKRHRLANEFASKK